MVVEVKWNRINGMICLKNFRDINILRNFINKIAHFHIQSAHFSWNLFFGEMTFVDLKSFLFSLFHLKKLRNINFFKKLTLKL